MPASNLTAVGPNFFGRCEGVSSNGHRHLSLTFGSSAPLCNRIIFSGKIFKTRKHSATMSHEASLDSNRFSFRFGVFRISCPEMLSLTGVVTCSSVIGFFQ